MATLHLNLKGIYFDMFLSGFKKEEYRALKESIVSILFNWKESGLTRKQLIAELKKDSLSDKWSYLKNFDTITFSNGYAKDRRQFVIRYKGIGIRDGSTQWGAIDGVKYFVLSTGAILNTINCSEIN